MSATDVCVCECVCVSVCVCVCVWVGVWVSVCVCDRERGSRVKMLARIRALVCVRITHFFHAQSLQIAPISSYVSTPILSCISRASGRDSRDQVSSTKQLCTRAWRS